MSSHHFVKEGQEPALFILNAFSLQHIEPLLEWAPLVITTVSEVEQVLGWGIKVDAVIAQGNDKEKLLTQLKDQMPVRIVSCPEASAYLPCLFQFLKTINQKALSILSLNADIFSELEPFTEFHTITVLDADFRWLAISHGVYEKWFPANTALLLKISSSIHKIELEGLVQTGNRLTTKNDGLISIQCEHLFWIGEPL